MEADKMFEELGYHVTELTEAIIYTRRSEKKAYVRRNICFYLKEYTVGACYDDGWDEFPKADITMQELKAINKKVEELGWI